MVAPYSRPSLQHLQNIDANTNPINLQFRYLAKLQKLHIQKLRFLNDSLDFLMSWEHSLNVMFWFVKSMCVYFVLPVKNNISPLFWKTLHLMQLDFIAIINHWRCVRRTGNM